MFGDDLTAIKSVIPYRGFKLWMTLKLLRWVIAKETWGHGIGRHSNEDVWKIAAQDMDALSNFLGKKLPFKSVAPFGVLPMVPLIGNGTIGKVNVTIGITIGTNGIICSTLNDICIPLVEP